MAKDNTPTVIADTQVVGTNIAIDKEDVLMVAMDEAERMLRTQITGLQEQIAESKSLITDLRQRYFAEAEALRPDVTEVFRADYDNLVASYGGKMTWHYSGVWPSGREEETKRRRAAVFTCHGKSKSATPTTDKPWAATEVTMNFKVTLPKAVLKSQKALVSEEDNCKAHEDALLEARQKLSNLPQLERQYKAKLARHRLGKSAEGQEVLRVMLDNVHEDVLKITNG